MPFTDFSSISLSNNLDIVLVNMRTPRFRSLTDNFIENGLFILNEHMRKHGISSQVVDPGNFEFYDKFSPRFLTHPLNHLSEKLIEKTANGKSPSLFYALPSIILQKILDKIQNKRMEFYLEDLAKKIAESGAIIVGRKVWYGNSYKWAMKFARVLRKYNPEIIIVDGGANPNIYQGYYAESTNADVVIVSEGEGPLLELVKIVKKEKEKGANHHQIVASLVNAGIHNSFIKLNGKIHSSPIKVTPVTEKTAQKHEDVNRYSVHAAIINDAMGCPYNSCYFCDHKNVYEEFSVNSSQRIADEIEYFLAKAVGIFAFTSSSQDLNNSVKIAEEFIKRGFQIRFSSFVRSDKGAEHRYSELVTKYSTLVRAGLKAVFIGAESGSNEVLKRVMNKETTVEDTIFTVSAIREAAQKVGSEVDIILSLIYPHPTLGGINLDQAMADTLEMLKQTMPESALPNPPAPFTGSKWFKNEQFGFDFTGNGATSLSRKEKLKKLSLEMMELEYLLYLPPKMWKLPRISMDDLSITDIFNLNGNFRKEIRNMGIETDLTGQHMLMLRASGYKGKEGIREFKKRSMQSIISCNYDFIKDICQKVNETSKNLAIESLKIKKVLKKLEGEVIPESCVIL